MDPVKLEEKERQRRDKEMAMDAIKAAAAVGAEAAKEAAEGSAYKGWDIDYWSEDEKWGLQRGTLPDWSEIGETPIDTYMFRASMAKNPEYKANSNPFVVGGHGYKRTPNPNFNDALGEHEESAVEYLKGMLQSVKSQRLQNQRKNPLGIFGMEPPASQNLLDTQQPDQKSNWHSEIPMDDNKFLYMVSSGEDFLSQMSDSELKELEEYLQDKIQVGNDWLGWYDKQKREFANSTFIVTAEKEAQAQNKDSFERKVRFGKRNATNKWSDKISDGPYNVVEATFLESETSTNSVQGDRYKYLYMLDNERDTYAYYLATDPETAEQYLESLSDTLDFRADFLRQKISREAGESYPVAASLLSTVEKGVYALPLIAQTTGDAITGKEANPYRGMYSIYRTIDSTREGAMKDMNDLERTGMNVAYSMLDAAPSVALDMALPGSGRVYSGATSAAEGISDAVGRGASSLEALGYGSAVGVTDVLLDMAFSDIGNELGEMVKTRNKSKFANLAGPYAVDLGISLSENTSKQWANQIFDELINQENSYVSQYAKNLINRGVPKEEARAIARENYYGGAAFRNGLVETLGGMPWEFLK